MPTSVRVRRAFLGAAGVLAIAASAAGCGSSSTSTAAPANGGPVTVDIRNFTFQPAPVTVAMGTVVIWKNDDPSTHTATADGKAWDTGNIAPGASSTGVMFSTAGTFSYHCAIHQYMTATVVVTPQ